MGMPPTPEPVRGRPRHPRGILGRQRGWGREMGSRKGRERTLVGLILFSWWPKVVQDWLKVRYNSTFFVPSRPKVRATTPKSLQTISIAPWEAPSPMVTPFPSFFPPSSPRASSNCLPPPPKPVRGHRGTPQSSADVMCALLGRGLPLPPHPSLSSPANQPLHPLPQINPSNLA